MERGVLCIVGCLEASLASLFTRCQLHTHSHTRTQVWQPKMSLDTARYSLWCKLSPVENHQPTIQDPVHVLRTPLSHWRVQHPVHFHLCALSHCSPISAALWTVAHQALLSLAFSRREYWGGLPRPPPGDLPDPGVGPVSLESPALAGGFSTTSPTWEAPTSPLRLLKTFSTGLPWWLSGKEFTYQYRRRGSSPGPGRWKIPHAAGQLSPCTWSPRATVMKPTLEPVLRNKRRQHGEKPAHLY